MKKTEILKNIFGIIGILGIFCYIAAFLASGYYDYINGDSVFISNIIYLVIFGFGMYRVIKGYLDDNKVTFLRGAYTFFMCFALTYACDAILTLILYGFNSIISVIINILLCVLAILSFSSIRKRVVSSFDTSKPVLFIICTIAMIVLCFVEAGILLYLYISIEAPIIEIIGEILEPLGLGLFTISLLVSALYIIKI